MLMTYTTTMTSADIGKKGAKPPHNSRSSYRINVNNATIQHMLSLIIL